MGKMEGIEVQRRMNEPTERQKQIEEFLTWVREHAADNGYRAALRRAAGCRLSEADGKAMAAFYRAYRSEAVPSIEDRYFFAACVQCLWKPEELSRKQELIAGIRRMPPEERGSVEKRICAILDLDWAEDGYLARKLYRLISWCRSKGIVVDCSRLLPDLLEWNWGSRKVQKEWAKRLYRDEKEDMKESEGERANAD